MMVAFHLFRPSSGQVVLLSTFSSAFSTMIGPLCQLCVGIYAFFTGMTYYRHQDKSLYYSLQKIATLLTAYWVIVALFWILALLLNAAPLSASLFLNDLFPWQHAGMMCFTWYIRFYCVMMLAFPLIGLTEAYFGTKRWGSMAVLSVFLILFILGRLIPVLGDLYFWFPISFSGYLAARFHLPEHVSAFIIDHIPYRFAHSLIGLLLIITSMWLWANLRFDVLFRAINMLSKCTTSGLFILGVMLFFPFLQQIRLDGLICLFGKYSLGIWFTHGLFFSPWTSSFFQPFFWIYDSPAWLFAVTFGVSFLVAWLLSPIQKWLTQHVVDKILARMRRS